jgi:hypothetical protein
MDRLQIYVALIAVGLAFGGCDDNEISPAPTDSGAQRWQLPAGSTVQIGPVPETAEAFSQLCRRLCRTPEGAAAAMVTVMLACNEQERKGMTFATILLHPDRLRAGKLWQDKEPGQHARDMLRIAMTKPYVARSYLLGSSPANGYRPTGPFRVRWQRHARPNPGSGRRRVMLVSSGADNPRPVTLRKGPEGLWRVDEASSLFVGVRQPE